MGQVFVWLVEACLSKGPVRLLPMYYLKPRFP